MKVDSARTECWRGFFVPQTQFWRVNREVLLGLAGMRALLLELAHPLIAAGVADHSRFQQRPLRRLFSTMRMMTHLTFGGQTAALQALRHIQGCHRRVLGTLGEETGCYRAGSVYQANDPELKFWVLATLIDSSLRFYDLFIHRQSEEEKEAYYRDSLRLGSLLGIPHEHMPQDFAGFHDYFERMVNSEALTVGSDARRIVASLFAPTLVGRAVYFSSFVSVGMLPERLRQAYGLPWNDRKEGHLQRLAALSRNVRPKLPDFLCVNLRAWAREIYWKVR